MITVPLRPDETDALRLLAERERRNPRDQAALIIRRELERAGLLSIDGNEANAAARPSVEGVANDKAA